MTNETAGPTCIEYARYLNTTGCVVFPATFWPPPNAVTSITIGGACSKCGEPLNHSGTFIVENGRGRHAACPVRIP